MNMLKYSNIQQVIRTEPGHSVYEILFQFLCESYLQKLVVTFNVSNVHIII